MFKNMLPAIVGSGVVQINLAIDTIIASFIDGAPSILYFADRLNQFPLAIIGTALGTVLLPTLSKYVREENFEQANKVQNKALEVSLFLTVPCAIALALIGNSVVSFLFEHGNFTSQDSSKVAGALAALAFGLPAFVMVKIFTPRYFAEYDTATPVKISAFCIVLNVIVSLSLIRFVSYLGIAIATGFSAWVNVFLLYYFQSKRLMFKIDNGLHYKIYKIIIASGIMSLVLILFEQICVKIITESNVKKMLLFALEILLGMLVYFTSSYFLKILDLSFITARWKRNG